MPLVLDGTNGVSGVDGTASNPAIEGTDSNTGIFYPAVDTVAIGTGGTEALRVNSSQNVGIGTSSPAQRLHISGGTSTALQISATGNASTGLRMGFASSSVDTYLSNTENGVLIFGTNNTERARITSGGFSKFSVAGTYFDAARFHEMRTNQSDYATVFSCTAASAPYGINVNFTAAAPNNTTSTFLDCVDSVAARVNIRSNGGLANYSANNVNLSDRREKTNFAPAKNYLDVICAIPVQTFNYIDQSEDDPGETLGVVAQDVQAVAPEMVMESNWGTEENPKMRLSIYQTDLQYALMKSIQELKAIVDAQAAEIAALKGNA